MSISTEYKNPFVFSQISMNNSDSDNGEVKYSCTTHVKKYKKKKKLNSNYDLFRIAQILMEELNL